MRYRTQTTREKTVTDKTSERKLQAARQQMRQRGPGELPMTQVLCTQQKSHSYSRLSGWRTKYCWVVSLRSCKHEWSLEEGDPIVSGHHTVTKEVAEVIIQENIHQMLPYRPDKALYGIKHVDKAHKTVTDDMLLIENQSVGHQDAVLRRVYLQKVPKVLQELRLFSTFHIATEERQPSHNLISRPS